MIQIPLNKGLFALIDDADYELVNKYNWFINISKNGNAYAVTNITINGKLVHIRMHRLILNAKKGEVVDHEDHNTLNNQRYNIKITNYIGNAQNRKLFNTNTSGYCGVSYDKSNKTWKALIYENNKRIHLGNFKSKIDAIMARQAANIKYGYHINHGKLKDRMPIDPIYEVNFQLNKTIKDPLIQKFSATGHKYVHYNAKEQVYTVIVPENGRRRYVGREKDLAAAIELRNTFMKKG